MDVDNLKWFWSTILVSWCAAQLAVAGPPEYVNVPLGGGEHGIAGLQLATAIGMTAEADAVDGPAHGSSGIRLAFSKRGEERRIVALEGKPAKSIDRTKVLALDCRLQMRHGTTPRLALVVHEHDGGVWYRISGKTPPVDAFGEIRLPLTKTFTRALFAADSDEAMNLDQIERVCVALLIDGPAEGALDISSAVFTDEPFRPTKPLPVSGKWDVTHDPAVKGQLTMPSDEGPDGGACMKYAFQLPGGRHMYVVPRLPASAEELEGYSGLTFVYKATLPRGLDGLLVMLIEADGTQYLADPAPAATSDWKTVTIPFDQFHRGGWSADENDHLDLNDVSHVAIGMHGTATVPNASGTIMVGEVQFTP